jgi:biotin carboxylase
VGTTADYIHWIHRSYPNEALFLTDLIVRQEAREPSPPDSDEILCDLSDSSHAKAALMSHLAKHAMQLSGVVSFDCESMKLAACLARKFALPYPSPEAVDNCRNKYLTKMLWHKYNLDTPIIRLVRSAHEAALFYRELDSPCVLKPVSGSGSELIYRCDSEEACEQSFHKIQQGLRQRATHRLYQPFYAEDQSILAESLVQGDEYSCDFIIEHGQAYIIRVTRKMLCEDGHFGTTMGYWLPARLPHEINAPLLHNTLVQCTEALGLDRALCMLDFIVHQDRIILLELAPRPGGDCLPSLLRQGRNLDILKLFMDFARQLPIQRQPLSGCRAMAGLRLLASESGVLKQIDIHRLQQDARVREISLTRPPGHRIKVPPEDYESWCLGHIIVEPHTDNKLEEQCRALLDQVVMKVE